MTDWWEKTQRIVLNYFVQHILCMSYFPSCIFHLSSGSLFWGDFFSVHGFSLSSSSSTEFCMLESSLSFYLLFSDFFHVHNILILWAWYLLSRILNWTYRVSCSACYSCTFFMMLVFFTDVVAWAYLRMRGWIILLTYLFVLYRNVFP